jgi:hypothetical protein
MLVACGPSEEEVGFAWSLSPHADAEARAFSRWNDDEPAEIPENCAKCHSTLGYHDFLGEDGSTPGQVDKLAVVGTTIECEACHNDTSAGKDQAIMPSGNLLDGLGENANCMECHQGRASGVQVTETIAGLPPDTVNTEISPPNLHNRAVGPTQYGTIAAGGYEYSGKVYAGRYPHVSTFNTCSECHDAHSLVVDAVRCSACHPGVQSTTDFPTIRTGNIDYDGDGDVNEGMAGEVETMRLKLKEAIDRYTAETEGVETIVLTSRFTNEAGDAYATWTPRLMRSAFNYVYSDLDAAGYTHNPHYMLQLLFDSIEDMGGSLSGLVRP